MDNLSELIKKEREKKEQESPQNVQSPANVRSSLMALKNAVDGFGSLEGNPLIENIKKVETVIERKDNNGFIQPNLGKQSPSQKIMTNTGGYDSEKEKEDQFTKDLLMKTRQFVTGGTHVNPTTPQTRPFINEEIHHPEPTQPDHRYNYINPSNFNIPNQVSKTDVLSALKDTITDLYVKEKVESIIREYLQTDEGKMLIKSIVVGLFKKK